MNTVTKLKLECEFLPMRRFQLIQVMKMKKTDSLHVSYKNRRGENIVYQIDPMTLNQKSEIPPHVDKNNKHLLCTC